jgi:hypothetical protein
MKFALRLFVLASATTMSSACGTTRDSIVFAGTESSTVRLLESTTARPITNVEMRLRIYFEINCKKEPCAPDSTIWKGRADTAGRVVIPKRVIHMQPTAAVDTYQDDLLDNATLGKNGQWVLELTPRDSSGSEPISLKLFDQKSKEPFVNQRVTLTFSDTHGGKHDVALTTSSFGYIFVQPQIAAIGKHVSLKIPHYNVQFVFFSMPQHNIFFDRISGRFDYDR